MNLLKHEIGDGVILNGSPSTELIIIAKRKRNFGTTFGSDYFATTNFFFSMINSDFSERLINKTIKIDKIKMPKMYEDYNTLEQIKSSYKLLKESFDNKEKSSEFELVSEKQFMGIVEKIVSNTFEAVT